MNKKKAGWLMFSIIVFHIVAIAILKVIFKSNDNLPVSLSLLFGELIIGIPTVIFLIAVCRETGESPTQVMGFHKIKATTALLMIGLGLSVIPLATFINLLSMLITKNVVVESASEVLDYPVYMVILVAGIAGPIVEEAACRGMIFSGMRKEMSAILAVIMSAFVFGLFHMNLNQFTYAFAIGIFLALAVEATGSIWASFIVHMTINTQQMLKMVIANKIMPDIYSSSLVTDIDDQTLLMAAGVYLVMAGVCTCAAIGILILAANLQGRLGALKSLTISPGNTRFKDALTLPFIIGTILAIAFIIVYETLMGGA
ncbi:CAAX protease self-immunity [Lachnospiraceae bacterium XBB2008]|nr:CAAX protease self-immunity [Lachnospiraceae bacterium XBB2008]